VLKADPLSNPKIVELSRQFVPVYVDVDADKSTPQKFPDLRGIPDMRVITPDGEQLAHMVGSGSVDKVAAFMRSGLK